MYNFKYINLFNKENEIKMSKKNILIEQIKQFDNKYFNEDQKTIAINILENAPEQEAQAWADFLFNKRRTGFAFDYSPEIAKGRLITLREDKDRRINVDDIINEDENKLIIGDNYNALKSLLITHKEKIDVIYIDPPYNTESAKNDGNDSYKSGSSQKLIYKNKFGRTGWLNMMKDRLILAKNLLSQNGIIFCAIDDAEQAYLKVLMDDIFQETNFIANCPIKSQPNGHRMNGVSRNHEYILIYKNNPNKINLLEYKNSKNNFVALIRGGDNSDAEVRPKRYYPILEKNNQLIMIEDKDYFNIYINKHFDEKHIMYINEKYNDYNIIWPMSNGKRKVWQREFDRVKKEINNEIVFDSKKQKIFSIKPSESLLSTWLEDQKFSYSHYGARLLNSIVDENSEFRYPKSVNSIMKLLKTNNNTNSLILDFFAGSGTTGEAVMELNREDGGNRKFILVTNNENNIAHNTTFERLHRIIKGEGTKKEKDFSWLKNNKPYDGVNLRVINIDDSVKISLDQENIDDTIFEDCKNGLKLLDSKYKKKDLNLYYDLAALNPIEKIEE